MKQIFYWMVAVPVAIFFALVTFLLFYEWWNVKIKSNTSDYPWGSLNDNPWYYNNADIYAKVVLVEGLLMLPGLALTFWFLAKGQKNKMLYSLLICLGMFIIFMVNSNIN